MTMLFTKGKQEAAGLHVWYHALGVAQAFIWH